MSLKLQRKNGAPGTIRTSDPQIRSLMLYPAELRAPGPLLELRGSPMKVPISSRGAESNPSGDFSP